MKPEKKREKRRTDDKQEEEDQELQGSIRIQRSMMTEEQLNEVKPLTQFHKTGDRAAREKAPTAQAKTDGSGARASATPALGGYGQGSGNGYVPMTKESKQAYEELASLINKAVPDQPGNFLADCATETIRCFKSGNLTDAERKAKLAKLLGPVDELFHKIKFFCGEINDFKLSDDQGETAKNEGVLSLDLMTGAPKMKMEFAFEEPVDPEDATAGQTSQYENEEAGEEEELPGRETVPSS
jgi:hypothetical protein